jgi:carboxypeptidase C (cathepsin A)
MFYQIFGVPNVDLTVENDHPIFLWLQGGPGASSQFGAFT